MQDNLLKFIGGIAVFCLTVALTVLLGYLMGSVFDAVMGTDARAIFTVGGFVGLSIVLRKTDEEATFGARMRYAAKIAVASPFIAVFGMAMAHWLFPETTAAFMYQIGFSGSIYALAWWGTLLVAAMELAVLPVLIGVNRLYPTKQPS